MRVIVMLRCLVACALLVVAACGNSPTQPGAASIVSVTLTVPGFVLLGTPAQAAAAALLSDGSMATAGFTFSVSAPAVATASASGLLTGVTAGSVTMTATLQGKSASQTVRVVPDFHGTWTGTYTMDGCTGTGSLVCGLHGNFGEIFVRGPSPLTLMMTQANDAIVAFVNDPEFILTITGTIATDGTLTLAGMTTPLPPLTAADALGIQGWSAALASGTITGHFTVVASVMGGALQVPCTIVSLTRSGS